MHPTEELEKAIAEAIASIISDDQKPFVLGNHVTVAETASESGPGLVVLAPVMTPSRLSLLVKAIDHIVTRFLVDAVVDEGGDPDGA